MALANFFSKAALGGLQILRGFDYEGFAAFLEERVIGIALDEEASRSTEGVATLELVTNLLARLYPRLAIIATGGGSAEETGAKLANHARSINPDIEIGARLDDTAACLSVGVTRIDAAVPVVYLGSEGWIARVSPDGAVGSGNTGNPFGAGAAACFGAANVFRILFADHLPGGHSDGAFAMSLLDFEPNGTLMPNPSMEPTHIGESHLVGLGAIGNSAAWALARTPGIQGTLHLIDEESVDLSNLQRYVLAGQAHKDKPKVILAGQALSNTQLDIRTHRKTWGAYLKDRNNWHLERVAVAVDSARARCEIQASLPRWIVNAWTQTLDLGASRHSFISDQACLACLYLPSKGQPNEDQLVAAAIGLPEAVDEVRLMLYLGTPLERQFIERIASALGMPLEPLASFQGRTLRVFYTEAICGGIVLRFGGSADNSQVEVPMAFQSALAGIILAAELVADAGGLRQVPAPVVTRINLLQPIGYHLSLPQAKHSSGKCICQDGDYLQVYRAKYGSVGAH